MCGRQWESQNWCSILTSTLPWELLSLVSLPFNQRSLARNLGHCGGVWTSGFWEINVTGFVSIDSKSNDSAFFSLLGSNFINTFMEKKSREKLWMVLIKLTSYRFIEEKNYIQNMTMKNNWYHFSNINKYWFFQCSKEY